MERKFVVERNGAYAQDDDDDNNCRWGPLDTAYVYAEDEWLKREIGADVGGAERVFEVEVKVREVGRVDPNTLVSLPDMFDEFLFRVRQAVERQGHTLVHFCAFAESGLLHGMVLARNTKRPEWITWQTAFDERQFNGLFWGHYGRESAEVGYEDFVNRQHFDGMTPIGEYKAAP